MTFFTLGAPPGLPDIISLSQPKDTQKLKIN
eukprot:CAMPEP_0202964704 /NCGR_PEP_ID=MMETSP1396-20130829/8804_1 /ASSEMBLY_ACC=CAM_ASM_000872 /TAXON_ID= /ORGANISM="Pseudokeronopsis sp., Strain Brazil" /LENGTH=30 /DNA_ID= /DNA_START= /DNA_END= /DNA_ORIENTATION=